MVRLNLPPGKALLTVAEVAMALSFSKVTVRRWIKSGRLASVTINRARRIPREAVERLVVPSAQS